MYIIIEKRQTLSEQIGAGYRSKVLGCRASLACLAFEIPASLSCLCDAILSALPLDFHSTLPCLSRFKLLCRVFKFKLACRDSQSTLPLAFQGSNYSAMSLGFQATRPCLSHVGRAPGLVRTPIPRRLQVRRTAQTPLRTHMQTPPRASASFR